MLPAYYTPSIDYHGILDPDSKGTISSHEKSRLQFTNELKNLKAHGLQKCQHYRIKKEVLGEVLKIRKAVGLDNETLYLKHTIAIGNPTDLAGLDRVGNDVKDILDYVKEYGVKEVYFYGMDEVIGEILRSQRPAWKAVHDAGGKTFVAGAEDNIEVVGDIQDMHVRAGAPSRAEATRWHEYGNKIFGYAYPQCGIEDPVIYRRNFGLLMWQNDYDGISNNAYQHTFGATWNDFDHVVYRAHTFAYPTVDGVIDTIAWEGYREAIDDVRYITTLEHTIRQGEKVDSKAVRKNVEAAKKYVHWLKNEANLKVTDLSEVRKRIISHILSVRK